MTGLSLKHELLMDACIKHTVAFMWRGPSMLLVSARGLPQVLEEVISQGSTVLGYEGFEILGLTIRPRMDLIYDVESRPDISDPTELASRWPDDVWVDVVLAKK